MSTVKFYVGVYIYESDYLEQGWGYRFQTASTADSCLFGPDFNSERAPICIQEIEIEVPDIAINLEINSMSESDIFSPISLINASLRVSEPLLASFCFREIVGTIRES